jgi:hypothetical protein
VSCVCSDWAKPVSSFFKVTLTPGRTAPLGSVTVPSIPLENCAHEVWQLATMLNNNKHSTTMTATDISRMYQPRLASGRRPDATLLRPSPPISTTTDTPISASLRLPASLLYHNLKNGTFEEVGIYAEVALNHAGEEQAAWELQSLTTMKMVRLTSPKQTSATTFRIFNHMNGDITFADRVYEVRSGSTHAVSGMEDPFSGCRQ